ncbi:hypothetical protein DMN91_010077 [Ooceraea biroi]|uniref:Uncharacterized protein n=1 Tax=Ooceraea biroi TaxID=2015173 RepID=A0A3L8DD67_OOCBI|nr:hypothetical protein DMN91_010077 [Ooceraea biroi]
MTPVNVANIINMLATTFQIASITQTPITPFEIEVYNEIRDILQNLQDVHSSFEHDYVLDFADPSEPHGAQVVEYITPAEKEEDEDSFEYKECLVDDEGGKVDLSYKRKAVQFWKSGKKARRTLTSVQNSFRKVKSLQQLYRWEASVEKGGTNADKVTFITEYVLQKFEEACDRKSIVHDMNLRLWALEAKEQVDLSEFKQVDVFFHHYT